MEQIVNQKPLKVIGTYISPYVRKVLTVLNMKKIPYQVDPVSPIFGNDAFSAVSPLRRVPVLIDQDVTLADSTVICEYLDEFYSNSMPVYPDDPVLRAKVRWLEEYADTKMADVFIWNYFIPLRKRDMGGEEPDRQNLDFVLDSEIPQVLNYLESQVPEDNFLAGPISVADIIVTAVIENAMYFGFAIDRTRWPKLHALVNRVASQDEVKSLQPFKDYMLGEPSIYECRRWHDHRDHLKSLGATVVAESDFASDKARPGILRTL